MYKRVIRILLPLLVPVFLFLACNPEEVKRPQPEAPPETEDPETPAQPEFKEEPDDKTADKAGVFDYASLAKAGHPRLMMSESDFADLKTKISSGRFTWKTLYKVHQIVLSRADYHISNKIDFSSVDEHETIVDQLFSLTYAYRITKKEAYLAKAVVDLEKICSWDGWSAYGLNTGEVSFAVAIAYDWLYYDLSKDLRVKIHNSLVNKSIKPSMNAGFRNCMGNWDQVCNGGVMLAALALYEKDKTVCFNLLEKSMADNTKAMKTIYNPDGSYLEGIGYWDYGTTYEAAIIQTLNHIFGNSGGLDQIPGFRKSGDYIQYMHGTMNTSFSYADGGGTNDSICLASWWFAANLKRAQLSFCEKHMLDAGWYAGNYKRLLPLVPIFLKDFNVDEEGVSAPSEELWYGNGEMPVAMVRRGWKYDSSDIFLGIKGGHCNTWKTCNTAHGHMDAGSFVFEAEGVRWSDDIMRPSYSAWFSALTAAGSRSGDTSQTGLRWATFRVNNLCHSTISAYSNDGTVSGKLHASDYYVDGIATIEEVFDTPEKRGVTLDMTPPMKGQVKSARRTITLEGQTLVVVDEIEALPSLAAPLEWRMLSLASATKTDNGITLTKNFSTPAVRILTVSCDSVTPLYSTWSASRPSDWKDYKLDQSISDRVIVGWKATVPAGSKASFVTRLSPQ